MKRLTGRIVLEATGKSDGCVSADEYCIRGASGRIMFGPAAYADPIHILRVTENSLTETEIAPPSGEDAVRLARHWFYTNRAELFHPKACVCPTCETARDILERAKAAEPATAVMVEPTPDAVCSPEPDPAAELRAAIEKARGNHALNHHTPLFSDCGHPHCRLARAAEAYLQKGTK